MKKKLLIGISVAAVIAVGIVGIRATNTSTPTELVTVTRGAISSTTSITGTVEAVSKSDLAFERSGKITTANVRIGDRVAVGQELAAIDASDLRAQLAQTIAARDGARARLLQMQKGTRGEEIAIAETRVANARAELANATTKASIDLDNAYDKTIDTLSDAFTKSEDAVRVKTLGMFTNSSSTSYHLSYSSCNSQAQLDAENLRSAAETELNRWQNDLSALTVSATAADYDRAITSIRARVVVIKSFLQRANDTLTIGCANTDSTTSTYRTNIGTALTNVNTAATALTTLSQTIASQKTTNQSLLTSAQSALNNAQNELTLKRAGTTSEDIAAQAAVVKESEANILNIQAQLNKTIIRAPFAGIISRQDAKVGQIAAPNIVLLSLLSDGLLQITANVPEINASLVVLGNAVTITLDALPGETFTGHVQYIEPAATVVDGVANYKTTITFDGSDARIKSGFTANLLIETERKENALLIPNSALSENERGAFVQKDVAGQTVETSVTVGMRDTNGRVEITNGLTEGDRVAIPAKKK